MLSLNVYSKTILPYIKPHRLLLGYLAYRTAKWLLKYARMIWIVNRLKGMPMMPFIGNLHQVPTKRDDRLLAFGALARKYTDEPMFRFWTGWHPEIFFHRAESLQIFLTNPKNAEKSMFYEFVKPWLKEGLLTSRGEKWLHRRRLITPTFHFEILNDFLEVINIHAQILIEVLDESCRKNQPVEVFNLMGLCTLDVICETAMGQSVNAQRDNESEYVNAVKILTVKIFERANNPLLWPGLIYYRLDTSLGYSRSLKILHDFTRKVIIEKDAEFEKSNVKSLKRIAFLDMLLKAKAEDPSITFDDIQEEVDTFMFEGHDTTAAALTWALQMIGSNPEVQRKLHEEIDQVFGSSDRQLKSEDLGELKYLECVIKETLRLYPPVPFISREVTEDQIISGITVPKGAVATIFIYGLHRDEKYFPEPDKFKPERFQPQNGVNLHPFAYMPFSAGKRNCIGQRFAMMEEKVVLANILRRYELVSLATVEEIEASAELILRPSKDVFIKLKQR